MLTRTKPRIKYLNVTPERMPKCKPKRQTHTTVTMCKSTERDISLDDVGSVVYDTLYALLCAAIDSIHYMDSTTDDRLFQHRHTLANALAILPVVSRECNEARSFRKAQHAALIGYERYVVELHHRHFNAVPSAQAQFAPDLSGPRVMDRSCDHRWFLSGFGRAISLVEGPRDASFGAHPVASRESMWTMGRIERYHRLLIATLENGAVQSPTNDAIPRATTQAAATTKRKSCQDWANVVCAKTIPCADLGGLPSKVQTFVSDSRHLFFEAYTKFTTLRNVMFGRCHNHACDRVFFRGLTSDEYGKHVHSDGALADILADTVDADTWQYWTRCGDDNQCDGHGTQLRRFCTHACYGEWRFQIAQLTGLARIGLNTHSIAIVPRMQLADRLSLTLGEALRRNSRLARSMREAVSQVLPGAIRARDRDDVIIQLIQLLNIDTALLMSALEGVESNHYSKVALPGSSTDWRTRHWGHALKMLCTFYRTHEPSTVLTSLMTRPTFFTTAVANGDMLLGKGVHTKVRIISL